MRASLLEVIDSHVQDTLNMTSTGLKNFARGGSVTLVGQMLALMISLVSVVVMSRMLPPSDFGLIAMAGVVTALGGLLQDAGLGMSALKAVSLSNQQASNLFWINASLGLVSSILVSVSGPVLVAIYSEPRLAAITPFLALSLLFGGLQAQFQVQLARELRFGILAFISALSSVFGLAIAISCAFGGLGYWSLVFQTVATSFASFLMKVFASGWLPATPRRRSNTRGLAVSGIDLSASSLVRYFSDNVATFMLGVQRGPLEVGLFGRAQQLMMLPITLVGSLANVAVPTLTQAKKRGEDTNHSLFRIQSAVALFVGSSLTVTACISPVLFTLVLGPAWTESASLFRILSVGGVALGLSQVSFWAFLVQGRTRSLLKYNLVSKPGTTLLVIGGSFISIEGTVAALSLAFVLSWLLNVWWLGKDAGIVTGGFYRNGIRTIAATGLTIASASYLGAFWFAGDFAFLLVVAPASLALFVLLTNLSRGGRAETKIMLSVLRGAWDRKRLR